MVELINSVQGDLGRAERTRAEILAIATREFSDKGYSGARVDEIAEQTNTSKRMIYYYFGGKEGLYRAVLEAAYAGIRTTETVTDLSVLPPLEALARLVEITFDYHQAHPEFVRLVMNENIQQGSSIKTLSGIDTRNESVISILGDLISRGVREGVFREGLDPLDLHMTISALAFYNVGNRYTFKSIFGHDMGEPAAMARRRASMVTTVLGACRA